MKTRLRRLRIALRKTLRGVVYSRGSSHSIAAGVALGIFVGLTPTFGFQMIIAALLATLFRFNRLAAVLPVWITNPVTIGPIYYFNFLVGSWVLPTRAGPEVHGLLRELEEKIAAVSLTDFFGSIGRILAAMGRLGLDILVPLIVGSVIVGAVAAGVSYPLVFWVVAAVRRRREARTVRQAQERLTRLEAEGLIAHGEPAHASARNVVPPAAEAEEDKVVAEKPAGAEAGERCGGAESGLGPSPDEPAAGNGAAVG